MEIFLAVSLVVVIALSLLIIAVSEALLKQYEASLKEMDEELQALKFVNKVKQNIQIEEKPAKRKIKPGDVIIDKTFDKYRNDIFCMVSESSRCMKNIEASLANGDIDQAEVFRNFFMNIAVRRFVDDRRPEGFLYVADMFNALASKKIFEQRCKKQRKNS